MKSLGTFADDHRLPLIKPSEGVEDVGEGNHGESEAMDDVEDELDDEDIDDGSDEDGKGKSKNAKKGKNNS